METNDRKPEHPDKLEIEHPEWPAPVQDTYRPVRLLTVEDLIDMGIVTSASAAAAMRSRGTGPSYVKFGDAKSARVRYLESDVLQYIEENRIETKKSI